jgi:hypothetical protein
MVQLVIMLVGLTIWLIGELWGVYNHKKNRIDTTSELIWWMERQWRFMYVLVGLFVLSLFGHLIWHWTLLP